MDDYMAMLLQRHQAAAAALEPEAGTIADAAANPAAPAGSDTGPMAELAAAYLEAEAQVRRAQALDAAGAGRRDFHVPAGADGKGAGRGLPAADGGQSSSARPARAEAMVVRENGWAAWGQAAAASTGPSMVEISNFFERDCRRYPAGFPRY